jgi:hypothetical protein
MEKKVRRRICWWCLKPVERNELELIGGSEKPFHRECIDKQEDFLFNNNITGLRAMHFVEDKNIDHVIAESTFNG